MHGYTICRIRLVKYALTSLPTSTCTRCTKVAWSPTPETTTIYFMSNKPIPNEPFRSCKTVPPHYTGFKQSYICKIWWTSLAWMRIGWFVPVMADSSWPHTYDAVDDNIQQEHNNHGDEDEDKRLINKFTQPSEWISLYCKHGHFHATLIVPLFVHEVACADLSTSETNARTLFTVTKICR